MTAAASVPIGEVMAERFEVLAVLGHGSAGSVYKVRDLYVGTEHEIVALKVIHEQHLCDRQIFGRFRREAAILTRLKGDHVVELYEFIEEDGLLMIALEYVDGASLEEVLAEHGTIGFNEAAAIVGQICAALEVAHEGGVIHRDLKPSNVLLEGVSNGADGELKLSDGFSVRVVDFGMAKVLHGDMVGTVLTEHDMVFGTPDYMAPEQVQGEELDERCDLYATAAILYQMLTGCVLFDAPGPLATMAAHVNHPVPSPRTVDGNIPATLDEVIVRGLAKNRDDRYDHAEQFALAVQSAIYADEDTAADSLVRLAVGDTHVDSMPDAINTTLASPKNEALGAGDRRGAKVTVVVTDAAPASWSEQFPQERSTAPPISRLQPDRERWMWIALACVLALLAVAVGVLLGIQ